MVRDAEANAAEDRRRRDEVEVRNNGETLLYQTEKVLREQGGKLPDEERSTVDARVADLKTALGGSDLEAIKSATEALMTASQAFTQRLYEAAASESSGGAAPRSSAPSDDEVVDAEIVDDGDAALSDRSPRTMPMASRRASRSAARRHPVRARHPDYVPLVDLTLLSSAPLSSEIRDSAGQGAEGQGEPPYPNLPHPNPR